MEGRNCIRFGICSVEMVGVDELEESLVVKELGESMVWIWVRQFVTGGLSCAGMVEARESANCIGYSPSWLLDDDLERNRNFVIRSIVPLVRGKNK